MSWTGTSDDIKYKLLGLFILGWLNSYAKSQINDTCVEILNINFHRDLHSQLGFKCLLQSDYDLHAAVRRTFEFQGWELGGLIPTPPAVLWHVVVLHPSIPLVASVRTGDNGVDKHDPSLPPPAHLTAGRTLHKVASLLDALVESTVVASFGHVPHMHSTWLRLLCKQYTKKTELHACAPLS